MWNYLVTSWLFCFGPTRLLGRCLGSVPAQVCVRVLACVYVCVCVCVCVCVFVWHGSLELQWFLQLSFFSDGVSGTRDVPVRSRDWKSGPITWFQTRLLSDITSQTGIKYIYMYIYSHYFLTDLFYFKTNGKNNSLVFTTIMWWYRVRPSQLHTETTHAAWHHFAAVTLLVECCKAKQNMAAAWSWGCKYVCGVEVL